MASVGVALALRAHSACVLAAPGKCWGCKSVSGAFLRVKVRCPDGEIYLTMIQALHTELMLNVITAGPANF